VTTRSTSLAALLVLASTSGCTPPTSDVHAVADTPPPAAIEVPAPPKPGAEPAADASKCGRGTGRNAAGECETLRVRELDHAQQVQIPAGDFVMGDVPTTYDTTASRERPALQWAGQPPRLTTAAAFWIDLHEVTHTAYAACVTAGKCTPAVCPEGTTDPAEQLPEGMRPGAPQTCVTHEQAEAFCKAKDLRLPTEAEWELAARGPSGWVFPWGNDLKDEFQDGLTGIGGQPGDVSYFGVRGMGSSAKEWVSDAWDPDAPLRSYLGDAFRRPDGPLLRAESDGIGHVVKAGKVGSRRAASGSRPDVGFRCAGDLAEGTEPLKIPADAPDVPPFRPSENASLSVFGGVAEAVDRREAAAFCDKLRVPSDDGVLEGWRLPTLGEVQSLTDVFRGPGPFWIVEGAAAQKGEGRRPVPTDPWAIVDADPGESLAARCVRDR
jgi:formylglycine-generating enzyme required for sulfatase activity